MRRFLIGDIHGCYRQFMQLLEKVKYSDADELYLCGDIVGRGPNSLEVMDFVYRNRIPLVLGNHDLNFVAAAMGHVTPQANDNLGELLNSPNLGLYVRYLRDCPLLIEREDFILLHAGLVPNWTLEEVRGYARELSQVIQNDESANHFFRNMFTSKIESWSKDLNYIDRIKFIANVFTRVRMLNDDGSLNFKHKLSYSKGKQSTNKDEPDGNIASYAWFDYPDSLWKRGLDKRIVFGHWSTLGLRLDQNFVALDTGCLWKGYLTAFDISDFKLYQILS